MFKMPKKRVLYIAIFGFLCLTSFTTLHKYYVSVTDIEYDAESNAVQITSRVFFDDFERLLQERYEENLKLENASHEKKINGYIEKYFQKKLKLNIDGEDQKLVFVGREIEDDLLYCYFEIEGVKPAKKLSVTNSILLDLFKNQQNITHINVNSKKKSFLLVNGNAKGVLNF